MTRRRTAQRGQQGGTYLRVSTADIYGGVIPGRAEKEERGELAALAASIARHGLLQPVVVRRNSEAERYALVCGGRRLAACRMLGMREIDALLIEGDQAEATACFLEEHMTRRPPSPVDEAEVAAHAGAERLRACLALPWKGIADRLNLLALGERVCEQIRLAGMTLEQAQPLLLIRDEELRLEAASIIAARSLSGGQARRLILGEQGISPRKTRRRAVRAALEEAQGLAARLERQGVACGVTLHKQEKGICVQILIKSDEISSQEQEKQEKGENNAHNGSHCAGKRRARAHPGLESG